MAKTVKRTSRRPGVAAFRRPAGLLGAASALLGAGATYALPAGSLPQGGTVVGGSANISQSGSTLTVNQSSNRSVIDWRSFNIGSGARVVFDEPSSSSIAVNRVNASTNPSLIEGSLTSNGQVWVLNANGVLFGKTATVNVAGLLASTANIDPTRFMAGDNSLTFTGSDHGFVANAGAVTIADNGLAAFVAPSVRNSGVITAKVGKVTLAAGTTFTLDLAGDGLVELGLGAGNALVNQSGKIIAPGSVVTLTARSAGQVVDSVINMSGVISTASVSQVGGEIILDGGQGQVQVTGTADASGTSGGRIAITGQTIDVAASAVLRADAGTVGDGGSISAIAAGQGTYAGLYSARGGAHGGDGGTVETSGGSVTIAEGITVDTRAPAGATGLWTLDPADLTVGDTGTGTISGGVNSEDETISASTVVTALASTNVTLQATNSITVNSAINASGNPTAHNLTLADEGGGSGLTINLNAPIILANGGSLSGQGATINVGSGGLIQNGVDAASSGATINVAAGTYTTALDITKNVDIVGAGVGQTILEPTSLFSTGVGHKYDANVRTAVFVNGASDVNISGLTINANDLGANAVVFWNNASGSLSNVLIENPMAFGGPQTGFDLAVDATTGNTSNLTVTNATFVNWNKNAIDAVTGDGAMTGGGNINLTVTGSTFTGQGANNINPQNGILLWERGGGTINATVDSSSFSQIDYAGPDQATGILMYGSPTGSLTVENSSFDGSVQDYIALDGGSPITVNATQNNTFAGVNENGATAAQLFAIENRLIDATGYSTTGANGVISLQAGQIYVSAANGNIQGAVNAAASGDTVDVQAGTYDAGLGIAINTAGVTLAGQAGAVIQVPNSAHANGFDIDANNVAISGFTIEGPAVGQSYLTYAWGSNISRGVAVGSGVTGFSITNNSIEGVRNGILIDGRNSTGTVSGNVIDGTKSAISVQYTDGSGVDIAGNSQGQFGNEWGEILHLNGFWNGTALVSDPGGAAPSAVQQALLADSAANSGWSVQDEAYVSSNRTSVTVATSGSNSSQGSALSPLATIQAGVSAVVSGGTVFVDNGTYVIPAGASNYINVDKSLSLIGQSEDGVIIDARNASTYGLRVTAASDVTLSDFTLWGAAAADSYGVKVEGTNGLTITDVTSQGAGKTQFDLNGVINATLDGLTANGAPVGGGADSQGNGIAFTDSQNITLTNSTTMNNGWGGLALYQANLPTGYPYQETGITVAASNNFTESNPIYAENQSTTNQFGTLNIAGFSYIVQSPTDPSDVYTWFQRTAQNAIDLAAAVGPTTAYVEGYGSGVTGDNVFTVGFSSSGQALSIQAAVNGASSRAIINIASGTYAQSVTSGVQATYSLGSVTLTGGFTLQPGAAGSGLSGQLTAGSINLGAPVTLVGDLTLASSGGSIETGAIDASTPGGQMLTVDGGSGAISLGSLGATTQLGAVQISSAATLTGDAYNAASLTFGGDVTLTAASTTFNTTQSGVAGNITVSGSLLGSSNGAQSLIVAAGSGMGGASANGDISLQNVGAVGLALGDLTISGDNFDAQTVRIAGNFNSTLVGNQVFSSHTLDAGGSVTSTVGGDASGPINAGQSVDFNVAGSLTGAIAGTNVSLTAGTLNQATVNATGSADVNAGAVTGSTVTAAQNVSLNANTLAQSTVNASQSVNVDVTGSLTGAIAGANVSLSAGTLDQATVNATGSAGVNASTVTGSTFTAAQNLNLKANTLAQSTINASEDASVTAGAVIGSTVTASQSVNLTANQVAGSTLVAPTVTASATSFNGTVSASNAATVTGGDISGTFSGGSLKLAATGSVTGTIDASTLDVQAPQGNVTGQWQSLDLSSSGGVLVNSQPVTLAAFGANPDQLIVENFVLPAGTTVAPSGGLLLPRGVVINLLSPASAAGPPKLIQVQTVQDLGTLLSQGYTAIVIDLSSAAQANSGPGDDKSQQLSLR
ncbi:MAG TPA: filamentous hemagglutinin N-terminal domain-containing protein [Caulobacteraceae bacterium]|jgi:filamentous hemagglutinin family protein